MKNKRLRRQVALEAAKLMYTRKETEYFSAKRKAMRRLSRRGKGRRGNLPKNVEIRAQIEALADLYEGAQRQRNLLQMRLLALAFMRQLQRFAPKLIGSTLTGHIRQGSDIDIHLFSDALYPIIEILEQQGYHLTVERKRVVKYDQERLFTHIHLQHRFPVEFTVYPRSASNYVFKSSITGKAMETATLPQWEALLRQYYPTVDIEAQLAELEEYCDPWTFYHTLLLPLATVHENNPYHPEDNVLEHSLQVFKLARQAVPYDEELLLAALLHDVGKGIDPHDHVNAALQALEGWISPRVHFLIAHHMQVHQLHAGTLGQRALQRLRQSEYYDDLLLLGRCDEQGREPNAVVEALAEVLEYLRQLQQWCQGR